MLFAPEKVGDQTPSQFVTKPFRLWVNKTQKMNSHASMAYHEAAMTKMEEFLVRYKQPEQSIDVLIDNEAKKQMAMNQKVVQSLFSIVMLCGRQGLALRGHHDDRCFSSEDTECHNPGNFIELVRFRAQTDHVLRAHLNTASKNAHYTLKTIQNELINVISMTIRHDIVGKVKRAKFFPIIADETTDGSNKEKLSVSLRYILDNIIHEVFLEFLEVERITGETLARCIINFLTGLGLSLSDLRGQCYDGATNMAGAKSGCKSLILREAPKAIYVHCAAHRLNLAVVSACKIQAFKNIEAYIGEISRFFSFLQSAKGCLIESLITDMDQKSLKMHAGHDGLSALTRTQYS